MQLKRQFGLWTAIALIIGQVIAVGIFLTPAGMAKSVGSPFWLFVIWLLMGAVTLSGALCYGELAARFPEAGGIYVYLRESFGKPLAFLFGWMLLVLLDPGLTAAFGAGLVSYVNYLAPMSPFGQKMLAMAVIFIVGTINILGAKMSMNFLKVLTVLKVGTLLFIVFYGFLGGFGDWSNFTPFFEIKGDVFPAIVGGMAGAGVAFAGWWEVTRVAGEIKNPETNLPKALAIGIFTITVIYILTSAVFFYLVPLAEVTSDETFAAQAGEALFGKIGGVVFASIVVISVLGTLFAFLMVSPRVYYAMARDGSFFKTFGEPHPRFNTPHRATLIQMILGSVMIQAGNFSEIIKYFLFAVLFFVSLAVVGLFINKKKETGGYKTPFYPFTPIFYLVLSAFILFLIVTQIAFQTLVGVGVVLLGLPVYYLVFNKDPKSEI